MPLAAPNLIAVENPDDVNQHTRVPTARKAATQFPARKTNPTVQTDKVKHIINYEQEGPQPYNFEPAMSPQDREQARRRRINGDQHELAECNEAKLATF